MTSEGPFQPEVLCDSIFEIYGVSDAYKLNPNPGQSKSIPTAFQPTETERISWRWRQYKGLLKDGFLFLLSIFFRLSLFSPRSNPYIVRNHICMLAFDSQGKSGSETGQRLRIATGRREAGGNLSTQSLSGGDQSPDLGMRVKIM